MTNQPKRRRGAPKGNTNALKHGRRSRRFAEIGAMLANDPELCRALLGLAANQQHRRENVRERVAVTLGGLYLHAESIARGEPSPGPFLYMITGDPADRAAATHARTAILGTAGEAIERRRRRRKR
jgi:hypothetical protein